MTLVQFDLERPNSAGYHACEKAFSRISHGPTVRGWGPAVSNFRVTFYLCMHPLTQNHQI